MTRSEQHSRLEVEAVLPAKDLEKYQPLINEALEAFKADVNYTVQIAKIASKTIKKVKYK